MRVLGPLEVEVGGVQREVPGTLSRRILAAFAMAPGRRCTTDDLIGAVWGEDPPSKPLHALRQHLTNLRTLLDPDRVVGDGVLTLRGSTYHLAVDRLDLDQFNDLVRQGSALISRRRSDDAVALLAEALGLWRGVPFGGEGGTPSLEAQIAVLTSRRLDAVEAWADAVLSDSEGGELIVELQQTLTEHPFRERIRSQLMLALYRAGRQAEALDLYQEGRNLLGTGLGLEPSRDLQDLEVAILRQDPWLQPSRRTPAAHRKTLTDHERVPTIRLPDGQIISIVNQETLIGRDHSAHVHLRDERVSRLHARIRTIGAGFLLEDLGSTNGTLLNGAPVDSEPLAEGDVISLGGLELQFAIRPEAPIR